MSVAVPEKNDAEEFDPEAAVESAKKKQRPGIGVEHSIYMKTETFFGPRKSVGERRS